MNNYTKSAEIVGKLLDNMEKAGCKIPSATLFNDGSGCFTVCMADEVVAHEVLALHLPEARLYRRSRSKEEAVCFDFSTPILENYMSVCPRCRRPLNGEQEE